MIVAIIYITPDIIGQTFFYPSLTVIRTKMIVVTTVCTFDVGRMRPPSLAPPHQSYGIENTGRFRHFFNFRGLNKPFYCHKDFNRSHCPCYSVTINTNHLDITGFVCLLGMDQRNVGLECGDTSESLQYTDS